MLNTKESDCLWLEGGSGHYRFMKEKIYFSSKEVDQYKEVFYLAWSRVLTIREENTKEIFCSHELDVGLDEVSVVVSTGASISNDKAGSGHSSLVVGNCTLICIQHQWLPRETRKMVRVVMWAWTRHWTSHIMERLILELVRTAVSPYCSILLSILCRVVVDSGGGGEAIINGEWTKNL